MIDVDLNWSKCHILSESFHVMVIDSNILFEVSENIKLYTKKKQEQIRKS